MFGIVSKKKYDNLNDQVENQANQIKELSNYLITIGYEYYDGEKEAGELGVPHDIFPDYYGARQRAWELQLKNDIAKTVITKWLFWCIGKGLRFNFTPPNNLNNRDRLIKDTEFRFRNYMQSRFCDYSEVMDFHDIAKTCTYNAFASGDVLVVFRVQNGNVNVQLIDGANICDPLNYAGTNKILDGVELDEKDRQVAYHVYTSENKWKRIPSTDPNTGLKMAFLVYGSKFRLNETRGLPMMIENYEKIKNLERYIDAAVKNAEITSELVFINEHDATSTGENVIKNAALKGVGSGTSDYSDQYPAPKCFQNNLAKNTKGVALNNTIGAKAKMFKPEGEKTLPDFLESNLKLIFASAGIPYEVAMSVYNSNYSASRAAIKDWEHNLKVKRDEIAKQIYKPFFELWLYNEVLLNRITYNELLAAYRDMDLVNLVALNKATFIGASVPSIDPLKEVNAVRTAMADETTPLMTGEQGAEIISQQDFAEIQEQVRQEREIAVEPKQEENG